MSLVFNEGSCALIKKWKGTQATISMMKLDLKYLTTILLISLQGIVSPSSVNSVKQLKMIAIVKMMKKNISKYLTI